MRFDEAAAVYVGADPVAAVYVGAEQLWPTTPPPTSYGTLFLSHSPWGYWRLDESSGSTAADSSGNGRAGTLVGSVTWGAGGPLGGTAAAFSGSVGGATSSTGITIPAIHSLSGAWTISGWVWQAAHVSQGYLIGSDNNLGGPASYWSITNRGPGSAGGEGFICQSRASSTTTYRPTGTPSAIPADSSWRHFAVAKPSGATGTMRFYVDGVEVHTAAAVAQDSLSALTIGRLRTANTTYAFTGRLAHVGIVTAELTAPQVAALAACNAP